jgi:hypothetical protein
VAVVGLAGEDVAVRREHHDRSDKLRRLTEAVYPPLALLVPGWIPRQIEVNDGIKELLQVDPFGQAVRRDEETLRLLCLIRRRHVGHAVTPFVEARHPYWYNPHYVVISGISDLVGRPGNEATRAGWKSLAARAAAHAARALVVDLLAADEPGEDQNWLQRLRLMLFPRRAR